LSSHQPQAIKNGNSPFEWIQKGGHVKGYLTADPEKAAFWEKRLCADECLAPAGGGRPVRIGLVWAGAPHREIREAEIADRRRSMQLQELAPLRKFSESVRFYSLQKGEPSAQLAHPPSGMEITDYTDMLRDFDDTAALASCLDLVIAVDTSTAHLVAGLGKPVWMLSRFDQCWRWLSRRTDSPWYGSLTIFQQIRPLDWSEPVSEIVRRLPDFIRQHSAVRVPENANRS
ncbi:hypothetical protein LOC54_05350, partial [Acetobacter sp. AN02]|nr:hypothetical protein [Acetobacter sp. AN02]